jgi:hypothetical protein
VFYHFGVGTKQDSEEAIYWYMLASDNGNINAQINLAQMFEGGNDTGKKLAYALYNLAATKGSQKASDERDKLSSQLPIYILNEGQKLTLEMQQQGVKSIITREASK